MRKLITLTIFFLFLLIPITVNAQQFIDRTVYFQPTDAPGPSNSQIVRLLIESQDFLPRRNGSARLRYENLHT